MLVLPLVINSAILIIVNLASAFSDSQLIYSSYMQLRVEDRDKCQKILAGLIKNSETSEQKLAQTIW